MKANLTELWWCVWGPAHYCALLPSWSFDLFHLVFFLFSRSVSSCLKSPSSPNVHYSSYFGLRQSQPILVISCSRWKKLENVSCLLSSFMPITKLMHLKRLCCHRVKVDVWVEPVKDQIKQAKLALLLTFAAQIRINEISLQFEFARTKWINLWGKPLFKRDGRWGL